MSEAGKQNIGVVVIGRNEGPRLRRCLQALAGAPVARIVYVDSESSDGSAVAAANFGADVVELDPSRPMSAARARNAGFRRLLQHAPGILLVQFIDGDCELHPEWIETARRHLASSPHDGAVCGDLSERDAGATVYKRLCGMEWKGHAGVVDACGGIFMVRSKAFENAGGFDEAIIAGEDFDLCLRIRSAGWSLTRLAAPMASHDAAMTRFSQWWKRAKRAGHAYAELARRHGALCPSWRRTVRQNWCWGVAIPCVAVAASIFVHWAAIFLLFLYPLWVLRIASRRSRECGETASDACLYAAFCMLSKFPAAIGQVQYWRLRLLVREHRIIEYKDVEAKPGGDQVMHRPSLEQSR
jgi:GT2 family glycosyltransferase